LRLLITSLVLIPSFLYWTFPAGGHETATGWKYEQGCCNPLVHDEHERRITGDCKVIEDTDVQVNADGSITILASGETFKPPVPYGSPQTSPNDGQWISWKGGLRKVGATARWSRDSRYHRCFRTPENPEDGTYCLYAPPPGF
jgi:hypothetical protein